MKQNNLTMNESLHNQDVTYKVDLFGIKTVHWSSQVETGVCAKDLSRRWFVEHTEGNKC